MKFLGTKKEFDVWWKGKKDIRRGNLSQPLPKWARSLREAFDR